MEADFMSVYGLDLREVLWGSKPLGARRLLSLVGGMPKTSALIRAVTNDWTQEDELLAAVHDQVSLGNHWFLQANSKPNASLPAFTSYPRPWQNAGGTRASSNPDEVRDFFTNEEYGARLWDAHGAEEGLV